MKEKIIELFDGIYLHILKTDKFKTNLISAFFVTDLNRENVTKNALIPAVLRRGTEKLPTMKKIATKLEDMYGSVLDASSDKIGDKQMLQFYIDSIADEYALEKVDLLKEGIELLCDVMLNPKLENGCFSQEYLEQEKETIRELIRMKINDKGSYAINRATEIMCKDEPFGLYKFGYEEDLEKINVENLYEQYKNVLSTSEIHLYVSGNVDENEIVDLFQNRFSVISRNYIKKENNQKVDLLKEPLQEIEKQSIKQGKLVLLYRLKDIDLEKDLYKMILYSTVLGGTASSKLFMNVREKQSLAYTVRSVYLKHKGILMVTAGIEIENYNKALTYIIKEILDMKVANISEEEINDAKANLITAYKSSFDRQFSLINFYMGQTCLGVEDDIPTMIEKIKNVTKEEIVEVANRLELQMTYFLTNND